MGTELKQVSDKTRDHLWEAMYDIARYTLYYELLANHFSKWNKAIRFGILVGAALAISSALNAPPLFGYMGAVALFFLTALDFVLDLGKKTALSHAASVECSVIEKDYENLWTQVNTDQISETECQVRINYFALRTIAATSLVTDTDRKINKEAQEKAVNILADRWGGIVESTRQTTSAASA